MRRVDVSNDGVLDLDALQTALGSGTMLVSITAVNNEIGTVQPIEEAAEICAEHGVPLHSDMTQAVGRIPVALDESSVAYASISSHKIYGPQGVGALFIRNGAVMPDPQFTGGGQEKGIRPGTLPVASCVGFGVACDLAISHRQRDFEHAKDLACTMLDALADLDGWQVNGSLEERIPHNLSIAFEGVDADILLASMPELALATGSACSAGAIKGSETLKAIGLPNDLANGTVRFGFGRTTTLDEVRTAANLIRHWVRFLRRSGMTVAAASLEASDSRWEIRPGPRIFSGHESFACRYGWLPKLYEAVVDDPVLFSSDEHAILRLGLGRNMVKSLRFWGEAFGLIRTRDREVHVTGFARMLLDPREGLDPYLETPGSLWRLHWMLTVHAGLGAWAVAFLETYDREITRERFVASVRKRASQARRTITSGTATNHVNVFLRTYVGGQYSQGSPEEALGSPFQELELLRIATPAGEPTVRFSRGPKRTLDPRTLAFVLHDFWQGTAPGSVTLSLRSLMLSHAAPGAVLLVDEPGLYDTLEELCSRSGRLALRSDGAGGFDLTCASDPLHELREFAWS